MKSWLSKIAVAVFSVGLLTGVSGSQATAAPAIGAEQAVPKSAAGFKLVEQTQMRRRGARNRNRWRRRGARRPPPGWRRYRARPRDYRRRGCVIIGPIWYCP
jgi:hypothetical protein